MDLASVRQKYNHRDYQTNGPLDRWYQDRTSANAFDTAMIPSINQWKLKVALPCNGTLTLGAKDFMVGPGAQWGYPGIRLVLILRPLLLHLSSGSPEGRTIWAHRTPGLRH